jgi:alpha-galactosidase
MSPVTLAILTNPEVIRVDQDTAGIQGHRIKQVGPLEIWMKPLSDGSKAVGLFNCDWGSMRMTVNFREVGLGASATIRDLWAHKDLGVFKESFTVTVPKHGVVMMKAK